MKEFDYEAFHNSVIIRLYFLATLSFHNGLMTISLMHEVWPLL